MHALHFAPSVVVLGIFTNDFTTSLGRIDIVAGESRLVPRSAFLDASFNVTRPR